MTPSPSIPTRTDVVVIGAGMGGLTAAALLSKAGLSVVVVEPEGRPGGYLAGFQRRGFTFDSAIHWLNQCGPRGFVHKVFSFIGDDFPVSPPLQRIRRYKGDSFDYLLTDDPDQLRDQLIADMPEDADGIRQMFEDAAMLGGLMVLYADLMRSIETMNLFGKARHGLRLLTWGRPFSQFYKLGAVEGLARYAPSGRLARIFSAEEDLVSVLVPIGWAYNRDFQAPPVGGSQAFPQWLVRRVRGAGGHVVLRKRVEQILLDGRRAVGVRLQSGEEVHSRYVLAACDLQTIYRDLLPAGVISKRRLRKLDQADLYGSAVTVSLGLDCPAEELGFDEEMIFLGPDDQPSEVLNGGDPAVSRLAIVSASVRDSSMAPEGKGTLTIFCPATMDWGDRWKTGEGLTRGAEYRAFKEQFAQVVLDRVEAALAPGLRAHVEYMDVATPVTLWRFTGNKDGSIMATRPSKGNIRGRLAGYRTPVKNLILSGHWAEYGGGVPIAVRAGTNAALLVLQRENKAVAKALARVMDAPYPPQALTRS